MEERFGIKKSLFEAYFLFSRSKGWWILKDSHHLLTATHLKVATAGMKAFHRVGQFIKPTTRMIQYFGRWATRSVLEMKTEQMEAILSEGHLSLDLQNEEGYVILVHRGSVLGLGLYVKNRIFPQLPREAKRCLSAFPSFPPPHSAE